MQKLDLNAPATLRWLSRQEPRERPFLSLKDAVRVAMTELRKAEFFSAHIATADGSFSGDEIVEIFQSGALATRRYARF